MMTDQEYEAILNDTSLLSSNGQPIKIFKDTHKRILKLKSLRITHEARREEEYRISLFPKNEKELIFFIESLHELFFDLSINGNDTWLRQQIRQIFYRVSVLFELVHGASIAKMLNDGFFFKRLTNEDPHYLHQLFEVIDVIYTRKIKI